MTPDSFQAQLSERAAATGLALDLSTLSAIEAYYRLLRHWNKRINLTSLPLHPIGPEGLDRSGLVDPELPHRRAPQPPQVGAAAQGPPQVGGQHGGL